MLADNFSALLKKKILDTGASACGFAQAEILENDLAFLNQWVKRGFHALKDYLEKDTEKRADPRLVSPNAKSVISVLYNYFNEDTLPEAQHYRISRYAHGRDYHDVIKERLGPVVDFITTETRSKNTQLFVDSGPVLEKAWAKLAGNGWIGKNTLLINEKYGSFNFIGTIITDIKLDYDTSVPNNCGDCNLCIEACPTVALSDDSGLDVRKCISNFTMQKNTELPTAIRDKFNNYIYGCDICQDVCPWNKNIESGKSIFPVSEKLKALKKEDFENLTEDEFDKIFSDSAIRWIGYKTLKRNIDFLK
ncbi:MAG: tRNA epoxyqueuosine(34) reductase QueG [Bacteroidales bacterium]|jgi:epoxyqueuosine reductase|nr:tRNA epoxyqueuosine(34) reductase QueG [Bacteroidales bacterium]